MPLIKSESGVLEEDNFLLYSPVDNFTRIGHFSRNHNTFTLSEGTIERHFKYNDFVLEIKRTPAHNLEQFDRQSMYCMSKDYTSGIEVKSGDTSDFTYWKIISHQEYLQAYKSTDGKSWYNIGGMPFTHNLFQGFETEGQHPLILESYKVYKSPYLTIQNFPDDTLVRLTDEYGNILTEAVFDYTQEVSLYLDYCVRGRLLFFDESGNQILNSGILNFNYGDVYQNTPYNIQLRYQGAILGWNPTSLKAYTELVEVINLSADVYNNIPVSVVKPLDNIDDIKISLDNINFSTSVIIPKLTSDDPKQIYISIKPSNINHVFSTNQFDLEVL